MLNVPKLGRWPLDQRESLVDVVVHISNSFQNGIQPELLAGAAFVSILTREFSPLPACLDDVSCSQSRCAKRADGLDVSLLAARCRSNCNNRHTRAIDGSACQAQYILKKYHFFNNKNRSLRVQYQRNIGYHRKRAANVLSSQILTQIIDRTRVSVRSMERSTAMHIQIFDLVLYDIYPSFGANGKAQRRKNMRAMSPKAVAALWSLEN